MAWPKKIFFIFYKKNLYKNVYLQRNPLSHLQLPFGLTSCCSPPCSLCHSHSGLLSDPQQTLGDSVITVSHVLDVFLPETCRVWLLTSFQFLQCNVAFLLWLPKMAHTSNTHTQFLFAFLCFIFPFGITTSIIVYLCILFYIFPLHGL